jgi:hypothetical protein
MKTIHLNMNGFFYDHTVIKIVDLRFVSVVSL